MPPRGSCPGPLLGLSSVCGGGAVAASPCLTPGRAPPRGWARVAGAVLYPGRCRQGDGGEGRQGVWSAGPLCVCPRGMWQCPAVGRAGRGGMGVQDGELRRTACGEVACLSPCPPCTSNKTGFHCVALAMEGAASILLLSVSVCCRLGAARRRRRGRPVPWRPTGWAACCWTIRLGGRRGVGVEGGGALGSPLWRGGAAIGGLRPQRAGRAWGSLSPLGGGARPPPCPCSPLLSLRAGRGGRCSRVARRGALGRPPCVRCGHLAGGFPGPSLVCRLARHGMWGLWEKRRGDG